MTSLAEAMAVGSGLEEYADVPLPGAACARAGARAAGELGDADAARILERSA
ncbi:MAG: hypothetical protein U1F11_10970 [Steroidobacteraceae bacterium]